MTRLPNGHKFLVSGLLDDREEVRAAMTKAFLVALLLAMLLATIGSLVIRRHLNRMVHVVAHTATNIADGNLSRRSPRNFTLDPLDCVAASLNRIHERIETLVEENRTMTDGLAHDLRSPLTRICASLEQAGRIAEEEGVNRSLHAIEQEVALMLRMIEDTLEISRAKAGIGREHFEYFDIGLVLRGLFEMYLPLAHVQGVNLTMDCEEELPLFANKGLITRAIANLIENAFKYGLSGKEIALRASASDGQVVVSVTDRGEGIPRERHDEALAKYQRLSRARSVPGMGLGLALVTAVAHLHNGRLTLDDNRPGLVAWLTLPGLRSVPDRAARPTAQAEATRAGQAQPPKQRVSASS
ncbi:HAMP domain-containing sensor histidine kinase [Altererythrobacter sp. H2]|uniref:HAMP domain-containing sensor histidine kinase n=1 Tax=Altererythrobacter sp. H2 TaxID=3108391 RepID=UPI002B4BF372|nr:HAMP domain-containing sensor histidine kinase [Altererythrobacter sp. H2]WRK94509.1 HAMP domain-containing sensor histidine kinase [Altererythrobacter sp. H2]